MPEGLPLGRTVVPVPVTFSLPAFRAAALAPGFPAAIVSPFTAGTIPAALTAA